MDKITRREFLKQTAILASGTVLLPCIVLGYENQSENQVTEVFFESMPNKGNLPPSFSRWYLKSKDVKKPIGSAIWFEDNKAKGEWITKSRNPELWPNGLVNLQLVRRRLNGRNDVDQTVFIGAGAFTPNWREVEGTSVDDGKKLIGNYDPKFKGFVSVSKDGIINLHYADSIDQASKLASIAQQSNADLFQTFAAIHAGNKTYHQTQGNNPGRYRFLVKRHEQDGTYRTGLIDFHVPITIQGAIDTLLALKRDRKSFIAEAAYFDMGGVAKSLLIDKNGKSFVLHDHTNQPHKPDGYTNLLAFYQGK